MARYRVLSWRDIPASVRAQDDGGRRVTLPLPDWFQQEVDRVAMRDGLAGSDVYLEQWSWSTDVERPGPADEVAAAVVAELVLEWRGRSG